MASQGSSLQNYNNELVACIDVRRARTGRARASAAAAAAAAAAADAPADANHARFASAYSPQDLRSKREEVNRSILRDEEEKAKIQKELTTMTGQCHARAARADAYYARRRRRRRRVWRTAATASVCPCFVVPLECGPRRWLRSLRRSMAALAPSGRTLLHAVPPSFARCRKRASLIAFLRSSPTPSRLLAHTERLSRINEDLARKMQARNEFDQTIQETEAAYMKILESSQTLLNVLKREAINLQKKRGASS